MQPGSHYVPICLRRDTQSPELRCTNIEPCSTRPRKGGVSHVSQHRQMEVHGSAFRAQLSELGIAAADGSWTVKRCLRPRSSGLKNDSSFYLDSFFRLEP